MRELHPDVRVAMAMGRELKHRIAEMRERADSMVARRPSPSGMVIPEVNVYGELTDLYLAPGTCDRFGNDELAFEIVSAVRESSADARRQYHIAMNVDRHHVPLAEKARQWRAEIDTPKTPTTGNREE
ncbi:hypothetical protein [Nocardia sp. MDA0666]|uniref:hypothetical protein n=1 Tax=Nocardia sp. MDA0666 TaxID=2135448 RepID=UPI0018ED6761|nr:hypothetical protein [Nocardia sp. MDA0666]